MRSDYQDFWAWACSSLRVFFLLVGILGTCGFCFSFPKETESPDNDFQYFGETPPDVDADETATFLFSFPSSNESHAYGSYRVSCEIPAGLAWENWTLRKGTRMIHPDDIRYDQLSRELTAYYSADGESLFSGTELSVIVRGDCSERGVNSGERELILSICMIPQNLTARMAETCLIKDERFPVTLRCPENTCPEGGMIFYNFDLERINLGQLNDQMEGLATQRSQSSTEPPNVYRHTQRLMYGDTLKGLFEGVVAEIDSPAFWQHGFASSRIEHGENLEPVGAKLTIYDASLRRYLRCDQIEVSTFEDYPNRMFFYDITPEKLAETQASFIGYVFEGRDSVWLETLYRVHKNLGDSILRAQVENRFYLSDVANPTKRSQVHQCGNHDAAITLLGFDFLLGEPSQINVSYPSQEISQPYRFLIGGSDMFTGGDPFPFEYRYFGHIKRAQMTLPPHYEVSSLSLEHEGEVYELTYEEVETEPETDTALICQEERLEWNLEDSFLNSRGDGILGDGEFHGKLLLRLTPTCHVSPEHLEKIKWSFTYAHSGWLNGGKESRWYHKEPDRVHYQAPQLGMTYFDPSCRLESHQISWVLSIRNPKDNPVASHSWIYVFSPDSGLEKQMLVDLQAGDTLQAIHQLYRLGQLQPGEEVMYEVSVQYEDVPPDFITVYSGFDCNGYPVQVNLQKDYFADLDLFPNLTEAQLLEMRGAEKQVEEKGNDEVYEEEVVEE
ncbi:MAG: hypothetical protein AAF587_20420 [Bacteroidota bacterium]